MEGLKWKRVEVVRRRGEGLNEREREAWWERKVLPLPGKCERSGRLHLSGLEVC